MSHRRGRSNLLFKFIGHEKVLTVEHHLLQTGNEIGRWEFDGKSWFHDPLQRLEAFVSASIL